MKLDTRAGSGKLADPLRAAGVTVEECVLPAGDMEIVGCGPEGRPVLVGIEYKTIEDATSCMRNGRFAEQLRAMRESFEVSWLVIEGRWSGWDSPEGISVKRGRWFHLPGRIGYQEVAAWTMTMAQVGGVLLWRTETEGETVAWLRALEKWWTAKEWEDHRAHTAIYTPPFSTGYAQIVEPTLVQRVAAVLPHIGSVKAHRVAKFFRSVREMVAAPAAEWVRIEGVGKKSAADIVAALEEEK